MNTIQYIDHWNIFFSRWYSNPTLTFNNGNPWSGIHNLQVNALPEPYCGDPHNFSALILQLNPGLADPVTQMWQNGTFIQYIRNNGTYYNFAKIFPYFPSAILQASTAGQKFWITRNKWISRLVGTASKNIPGSLNPLAIDLCPWHSQAWKGFRLNQILQTYIQNYIIDPIPNLILNAKFKLVLCVGNDFNSIFQRLGFTLLTSFGPGSLNMWPSNINGPINRYYKIWEASVKVNFENTNAGNKGRILFLVTYSQGGFTCPSSVFQNVELHILNHKVNQLGYQI
jgi:hypothetical protein